MGRGRPNGNSQNNNTLVKEKRKKFHITKE